MNRRELMAGGALVASGALAASTTTQAATEGGQIDRRAQVPPIWRFKLGRRTITVVSDGFVPFEGWHTPNIEAQERARLLEEQFLPADVYQGSVNSFIVEDDNGVTLIDGGTGQLLGPPTGHLVRNMRAAGFEPEDITTLLVTHLHPDHVGGVYTDQGAAVFPNAEFVVAEEDHRFWTDAGAKSQAPEGARFLWDIAGTALSAYSGRVRRFEGTADVMPGITPVPLPGHTPGQTGFQLSEGNDTLLIWADLIHVAPLQLKRPEVTFAFDVDADLAVETRRRVLDMVASERTYIAGMHLPFPGTGHLVRAENGYDLVPSRWDYDLA